MTKNNFNEDCYTGIDFINNMSEKEVEEFIKNEDIKPDFDIKQIDVKKYEFTTKNNLIYHVDVVESIVLETNKKILTIKFRLMNNPNQPQRKDFQNNTQYQVALQKSQVGLTKTGNPNEVFRKVLGAIIIHFKKFNPDYVTFIGDERRINLYNKLINIVKKYVQDFNYKQLNYNPVDNLKLESGEFWLEIIYNKE